jgi:integrase
VLLLSPHLIGGRYGAYAHTFESVARSWLKVLQVRVHKHTLTATTVEKNLRLLERYIFPRIGLRPIAAIAPSELLVVLKEIESHGFLETARRVKQRCSRVFGHAIGLGYLHCDITEGFRGLLERPKHRHHPAIRDPRRFGELLRAVDNFEGRQITAIASTHSARQPIHSQALSHALRSLGFLSTEVTPHGFRATACTLLNELGWNADAIERQLAHGASDDLRRVYNYAQYLPARRLMMQAWADYLDQLRITAQLIRPLPRRRLLNRAPPRNR